MRIVQLVIMACMLILTGPSLAQDAGQGAGGGGAKAKFQSWDSNGDGLLSAGEWQGPAPRFKVLDKNGDAMVSLEEFIPAKTDQPPQQKSAPTCDSCQDEWRSCMVGKPGFIKQNCDIPLQRCTSHCQ